jgi:hypothetical protein
MIVSTWVVGRVLIKLKFDEYNAGSHELSSVHSAELSGPPGADSLNESPIIVVAGGNDHHLFDS